jgi:hypothetical protein
VQGERDLEEFGEEPIEQGERRTDLVLPEERRGEPRFRDNAGEFTQTYVNMDAGRVENPSPLSACAVWFDEEDFAGKLPGSRKILLYILTATLEFLELRGEIVWEVTVDASIPDERIDILSHQVWGHERLLSP